MKVVVLIVIWHKENFTFVNFKRQFVLNFSTNFPLSFPQNFTMFLRFSRFNCKVWPNFTMFPTKLSTFPHEIPQFSTISRATVFPFFCFSRDAMRKLSLAISFPLVSCACLAANKNGHENFFSLLTKFSRNLVNLINTVDCWNFSWNFLDILSRELFYKPLYSTNDTSQLKHEFHKTPENEIGKKRMRTF